ncbi:alpha beta hydrolase fold family [Xylariaceae sp. FL0016]|nr:alpha beta hydrolase fold family [Xylariaceae sp. FL0016]
MMVASRRILSARPSLCASLRALSRPYSSNSRVSLVFDHHEPPNSDRHRQDAPIIFMHGLFGSKKNNRSVCKVLARNLKRHVYALDLRNHGESPHAPTHNYTAMADDVAGFIADHDLSAPTLIGHSMGAKTAMVLGLDAPHLVAGLVSVDNAPVDAVLSTDFAKYVRGMRRIEDAGVMKQSEADAILKEYEPELPIRQFLLGNLHRPQGSSVQKFRIPLDVLAKNLNHMGDFPFKDPAAARFEKPALFVRGTHSKYVADESLPLIGQFFPRFQLVDIEAGHWLISEKPAEFLQAVIEFLTPKE